MLLIYIIARKTGSSETLSSGVCAWILGRQANLRVILMVIAIVIVNVQVPFTIDVGK